MLNREIGRCPALDMRVSLSWFTPKIPVKTNAGHRRLISSVLAASEELLTWTRRGP